MQCLAPDYVYTPQGVQSNMLITINDDGQIAAITHRDQAEPALLAQATWLPSILLLPGFVNTHSHVFQRLLRGHTHRARSKQDSFWTWRGAMYAEASRLQPDTLYEVALHTYREMLQAGYTSVGEFHYLHHQPGGKPYAHPNAMAEAVLSAARDAGICIALLMTAYAQGGIDRPLEEGQKRFSDASVEAYLERVESLRSTGTAIGVAPHSVRAVPESWLRPIAAYSHQHALPLHIHADEQRAEVEQCQHAYDCTPIELLERFEALGPHTTVIHATHATATEISLLKKYGSIVCVCPTTEGDLGDGIAPYAELINEDILLSIGSDSNTRLDPFEELRWAEYTARMRYEQRRILVCEKMQTPGPLLLDIGSSGGAQALGLQTGLIQPGMAADFVAIDLSHPMLHHWTEEDLLDQLFFGASSAVIKHVWVQGKKHEIYQR